MAENFRQARRESFVAAGPHGQSMSWKFQQHGFCKFGPLNHRTCKHKLVVWQGGKGFFLGLGNLEKGHIGATGCTTIVDWLNLLFFRAMVFILVTVAYGKTMIAGIAGMLLAH